MKLKHLNLKFKKHNLKLRNLVIMLTNLVLIFSPSTAVFAIDEATLDFFDQNNIYYYNPSGIKNCSSSSEPVTGSNVTIIGDSISVQSASEYDSQIPGADHAPKTYNGITYQLIQSSKNVEYSFTQSDNTKNYSGIDIARQLQEQGDLHTYVVFALGTNNGITSTQIDTLMSIIGTSHKIVLVTNYAYDNKIDYSNNNNNIKTAASKYSNITVADWAAEAGKDQDKYIGDQYVHPSTEGSKLFVKTIANALQTFGDTSVFANSTGNGKNYAGDTVFSDAELQMIENNKPFYIKAANKYNIPWQVIAVIHSNESSLRRYNPEHNQTDVWIAKDPENKLSEGPYGMHSWALSSRITYLRKDSLTDEEFQQATYDVAQFIVESYPDVDFTTDNGIKRLFFRFNGTSQLYIDKAIAMGFSEEEARYGEGSSYVMNRFDAARDPAHPEGMNSNWPGRYVYDGVYDPNSVTTGFGAFTKYAALGGSTTTNYCNSNNAGATITNTAINISWGDHWVHDKSNPIPSYVEAMKAVGTYITPCNSTGCAPKGASCDIFVSTVIRYSGIDPNFPKIRPGGQEDYMKQHPEKYQLIETGRDASKLQTGDIFVMYNHHIYIYIEIDGKPGQASASFNNRTGEHYTAKPQWSDSRGEYHVYRVIQ